MSREQQAAPHVPVLIDPLISHAAPISGDWVDGTFGAGGYTRALLGAGAARVFAIDRDPEVFERAESWATDHGDSLHLIPGAFGDMADLIETPVDGVVLDIGVSSMQIDQPERGFSFMADGPLDMRMSQSGQTAADIVNGSDETTLADILFHYGEERASRRIAKRILAARAQGPIETTAALSAVIEGALPRAKPGQPHPATRSFQALRIAVNDELGQLVQGLEAAEQILGPGGVLAVVTFHSLEDRIVKRFLQNRSATGGGGSRHAPQQAARDPQFTLIQRRAIVPDAAELDRNPRARSAKLRLARRTDALAGKVDRRTLGVPKFDQERLQ